MSAAIELREVHVRYGDVIALEDATLIVQPGRVCGLIGVNGSGKSTLLKTVIGLVRPVRGEVSIEGASPAVARRAGIVGYVPQSEDIDWAFPLTVRDVVMTGRYGRMGMFRRASAADREAVDRALERVDLTGLAHRQIGELSGGQRKRVFVARGLAQEARILLLDEPFAGVDAPSQQLITGVLRELAAHGATVLVATHDLAALPHLADEAVLLWRRVMLHDVPEVVLRPEQLVRGLGLEGAQ